MKLDIAPTDAVDRIGDARCSRWEGVTDKGTAATAWLSGIALDGSRNYWALNVGRNPEIAGLPSITRALLLEDGLSGRLAPSANDRDNPFADTIWEDRAERKRLMASVSHAAANTHDGRMRLSRVTRAAHLSIAMSGLDRAFYEAARDVVIAERRAASAIAAAYSPEAAEAILNRPLPPAWSKA